MKIYSKQKDNLGNCNQPNSLFYNPDNPTSAELDLFSLVNHELSHTLKLDDLYNKNPPPTDASVMNNWWSYNSIDGRFFWQYDYECVNSVGSKPTGTDQIPMVYLPHDNYGVYYSPEVYANYTLNGQIGYTEHSSVGTDFVAAITGSVYHWWYTWVGGDMRLMGYSYIPEATRVAPLPVGWEPDNWMDYLFYTSHLDNVAYSTGGKHYVKYYRSNDGFVNHIVSGTLGYCNVMNSPSQSQLSCDTSQGVTNVNTAMRMTHIFEPFSQQPLIAWIEQTRLRTTEYSIKVSVGKTSNAILSTPDTFPMRTLVPPGIACQNGAVSWSGSTYDCILAYVDPTGAYPYPMDVKLKAFNVRYDAVKKGFKISVAPGYKNIMYNVPTFSPLTAWYNHGKFHVAMRSGRNYQPIEVFSSTDTGSWTFEDNSLWSDYFTAGGPSSARLFDNRMVHILF